MKLVAALVLNALICSVSTAGAVSQDAGTAHPLAAVPAAEGTKTPTDRISAVRCVFTLSTSISSKSTNAGQVVKASLKSQAILPGGTVLPKGSVLMGTVLDVSKHRKDKPNGVVILEFHTLITKEGTIPVLVRLKQLAPGDETDHVELPSNGHEIARAGNSGGGAQIADQWNDHTSIATVYNGGSTIDGVYLTSSEHGAGTVFALKEDLYLDSGVQMTALVARIPE